jgi:hypothetical protein
LRVWDERLKELADHRKIQALQCSSKLQENIQLVGPKGIPVADRKTSSMNTPNSELESLFRMGSAMAPPGKTFERAWRLSKFMALQFPSRYSELQASWVKTKKAIQATLEGKKIALTVGNSALND